MVVDSIYLYHLDAEVQKMYIKSNSYNKNMVNKTFSDITRLGFLLCKKNLFIPLSNYLESTLAFNIINFFSEIESSLNPLRILSTAPNLEVALRKKEQEHGDAFRENQNYVYHDFERQGYKLPGVFQTRHRSASADIENDLKLSIGDNEIWEPLIKLKSPTISYCLMEQQLADIPRNLDGRAYISEYILPFLSFNKDRLPEADRIMNLRITRMYLKSFLTEIDGAVCLNDIPFINASELLPEMSGRKHLSYSDYVRELKAIVHKQKLFGRDVDTFQYISSCSANELLDFKHSVKWKSICTLNQGDMNMNELILPTTTLSSHGDRRFKVALSFPGEQRGLVEQIAAKLANKFTKDGVFYDIFHRSELARLNLDVYLQGLYRNQSDLIVIFLCAEYDKKKWCGIEWRAIRDLINQKTHDNRIMFVKCGNGDVQGVFGTIDGYLSTDEMSVSEITDAIIQRHGTIR
jgi:hypothetical protein